MLNWYTVAGQWKHFHSPDQGSVCKRDLIGVSSLGVHVTKSPRAPLSPVCALLYQHMWMYILQVSLVLCQQKGGKKSLPQCLEPLAGVYGFISSEVDGFRALSQNNQCDSLASVKNTRV